MSNKVVTKKDVDKLDGIVSKYLESNPKVKKAMTVFNISKTEYAASVNAKLPAQVISSKNTVVTNGDLARNN